MLQLRLVWAWIKKYWKWIIFPVGITLAIAGLFASKPQLPKNIGLDYTNLTKTLEKLDLARSERDRVLNELKTKHQQRLQQASLDEQKELKELEEKPIADVVAWFDRL